MQDTDWREKNLVGGRNVGLQHQILQQPRGVRGGKDTIHDNRTSVRIGVEEANFKSGPDLCDYGLDHFVVRSFDPDSITFSNTLGGRVRAIRKGYVMASRE